MPMADPCGATLASYMLFDKGYCRALIDRGYADSMARREELAQFFDANVCPLPTVIPIPAFDPGATAQFGAIKTG